jgi:hypothetical protein
MSTFPVSDVRLSRERLAPIALAAALRAQPGGALEACAANTPNLVVTSGGTEHPFIAAAGAAFASHYPLTLSPDDVWLCLAQGFALHLNQHAEALRDRVVKHAGKAKITVRRDEFVKGSPDNDWPGCFAEFSRAIAAHTGKLRDLVVADFSTTGPVERAASDIVLMSATRSYFDYELTTLCGIPSITLLGTEEDYRSIRRRVAAFAEFELGWWTAALNPVLDALIAASRGVADTTFWRSFYKRNDGSGGPYVTGWINTLFPYVDALIYADGKLGRELKKNPFVENWAKDMNNPFGGGPKTSDFTASLSVAPFDWNYLGEKLPMELLAGFVGVSQDVQSLALRPAIGWAVRGAGQVQLGQGRS